MHVPVLRLLSLPLPMGAHPDGSGEITLKNGRFGPYLELVRAANGEPAPPVVSVSLPKAVSIFDVELPQAAELLDRKRAREACFPALDGGPNLDGRECFTVVSGCPRVLSDV